MVHFAGDDSFQVLRFSALSSIILPGRETFHSLSVLGFSPAAAQNVLEKFMLFSDGGINIALN